MKTPTFLINEGVKLFINERFDCMETEFFLINEGDQSRRSFFHVEDGRIVQSLIRDEDEGKVGIIKPFFTAPSNIAMQFLRIFAQAASDQNIKTKDENLLLGKLEATELHLTDMRESTKLLLKNITK